jgi:hypothetical protein
MFHAKRLAKYTHVEMFGGHASIQMSGAWPGIYDPNDVGSMKLDEWKEIG